VVSQKSVWEGPQLSSCFQIEIFAQISPHGVNIFYYDSTSNRAAYKGTIFCFSQLKNIMEKNKNNFRLNFRPLSAVLKRREWSFISSKEKENLGGTLFGCPLILKPLEINYLRTTIVRNFIIKVKKKKLNSKAIATALRQ
jgi:hypothetical protein